MYCNAGIYGLYPEEAACDFIYLDVIERTNFLRNSGLLDVVSPHERPASIEEATKLAAVDLRRNIYPEKVIAISHHENGEIFYLDFNQMTNDEPAVVAISGYFGPSVAARCFLKFLQVLVLNEGASNAFNLYS